MKNIKNIAFAALITLFAGSCKKEATTEVKKVTLTKTEIAAENIETASFTIEGKLSETVGVGEAKVDFESKIATVKFDKTKQTIESLSKAIEKVGGGDLYKVTKSEKSSDKA